MISLRGRFVWSIEYEGAVIDQGVEENGMIVNTIDDMMDVYFSDGTPETFWYLGLISDTNWDEDVGLDDDTDTMASHAGWEEATNYSGGDRPAWAPENSVDGLKKNLDHAAFTINAEEDLRGMFVASNDVKGGFGGTLWSTATFNAVTTPPVGAVFKLFYELEAREG